MGIAFLYNQGCYLADTEVKLNHLGLKRYSDLDNHTVIDVCGVGLKHLPPNKKHVIQGNPHNFELSEKYEYGYNILRGIEVKVSRSDFRNGFVCSGCNYHYILTPMRMVAPYEVPKGIGLIEYNKHKFSCELNEDEALRKSRRPFNLKGIRVIKRPAFRDIPQFQIDDTLSRIAVRFTCLDILRVDCEIKQGISIKQE